MCGVLATLEVGLFGAGLVVATPAGPVRGVPVRGGGRGLPDAREREEEPASLRRRHGNGATRFAAYLVCRATMGRAPCLMALGHTALPQPITYVRLEC